MGRRARRRGAEETGLPTTVADHQARVRVADDVWRDFKAATGGSISRAHGALVEEEVERYRARRIAGGQVTDHELLDALARAEELERRAALIVRRLEVLRSRPAGGQ